MGFYPLDQGSIHFDDHPMNGLALSAVRRSIGLVQQDPFIFVGTLAENLRLGRDGIDDGAAVAGADRCSWPSSCWPAEGLTP
jgi:ABC-type multidrug transport system fused ATPase/permease subunit